MIEPCSPADNNGICPRGRCEYPRETFSACRLLTLFVLLAGVPLAALGWLGWKLVDQDRVLESQREKERLENAAGVVAQQLERRLTAWDELLAQGYSIGPPPNTALLVFDSSGVVRQQGIRLPWYPQVPAAPEAPPNMFAAAEVQEFRDGNVVAAADAYRTIAANRDRQIRAAALMRLARSLRKQGKFLEALAVYGELAAMGDTAIGGSPAELIGRHERIALFQSIGDRQAAESEKALLASALSQGRYRIDRATFDFYRESTSLPPSQESKMAVAVENMWPIWQQEASGKTAWTSDSGAFASVWRKTPAGSAVIVADADSVAAPLSAASRNLQVRLALEDASGHLSWGSVPPGGVWVTKTFRETGLPWTIRVAAANPAAGGEISASRRRLMSAGFVLMFLVIAAAGYFVFRSVSRELGVARLQSDFVAAVSHEFRTPLTAMRHLTEMLEEGDTPRERLPLYYRALGKETRRLHGMVESLLDFGRMEAGRRSYLMEGANAAELARQVLDEFREHSSAGSHRLEWQTPSSAALHILADRDALALALRNLLDNAVKYSPEASTVSVSVESRGRLAGISVRDQGAGIPKDEQREIFRKFARGSSAREMNVKGTGIGLTMAHEIVKAHGGRLELASEPGSGSRFTILLPVQGEEA